MKTHSTRRIYRVRCRSGILGWRTRLRNNYSSFEDWKNYADTWGLNGRLGYDTPEAAWRANPVVEGSTKGGDYRRVKP